MSSPEKPRRYEDYLSTAEREKLTEGLMQKKISLEQIQKFYDMLTGESLPEGMLMSSQPQLSGDAAFSVIWFLQEYMHVFDCRFERCHSCNTIFDARESGTTVSDEDSFDNDDWYKEHRISEKTVELHYGNSFCSEECEVAAMRSTEQTLAADHNDACKN